MKNIHFVKYLFLFTLVILFCALTGDVNANNLVGGAIPIAVVPDLNEEYAKAAYNSKTDEYLVVWMNNRPGCDDIQAQKISKDGAMNEPPFFIAWAEDCGLNPVENRHPDVAYNSETNEYLVVWEQDENSILGRFISPDGKLIGSSDISIFSAGYGMVGSTHPVVEYAPSRNTFLVVWEGELSTSPTDFPIMAQTLNDSGELMDFFYIDRESGGESFSTKREFPQLIYNDHLEQYLVVWQEDDNEDNLYQIVGHQILWNGNKDSFIKIEISDDPVNSSLKPSVASIPGSDPQEAFLVVWRAYNFNIDGRIINVDGSLKSIVHYEHDNDNWVNSPKITGSESSQKLLLTWASGSFPGIFGQFLSKSGLPLGGIFEMDDPISASAPWVYDVIDGSLGDFLILWGDLASHEESLDSYDVLGQIVGIRNYLPLIMQ